MNRSQLREPERPFVIRRVVRLGPHFQCALIAMVSACLLTSACNGGGKVASSAPNGPLCASDLPDPATLHLSQQPVAILTAKRQNSSPVDAVPDPVCESIIKAAESVAPITVVTLDGRPNLKSFTFSYLSKNPPARARELTNFVRSVAAYILTRRASSPHVDLTQAISIAGDELHGSSTKGGSIYVLGSALQETSFPDFSQPGMLDADPNQVAAYMKAHSLLVDLKGIKVTFFGATYTARPQVQLNPAQASQLRAIWTAIITAEGGGTPTFLPPKSSSNVVPDAAKLPKVKLVVPTAVSSWNVHARYPDSGPLHFEPDSAKLTDPVAASEALAPVPSWLSANPKCTLLITGTTANVGPLNGQKILAGARANTIRRVIGTLGADVARIDTLGLGSSYPGYVPDHDRQTGDLLPDKAALNRSVYFKPSC
jgi:outer membrane protein OmpA-like peptidoglycan-associated protein